MKQIANAITTCRIFGSGLLICFPLYSPGFYLTYLICGISDMIDGTVARMTSSTSGFGEKLDTAADFLFFAAAFGKILPVMQIPVWLWVWIGLIAGIKIRNFARSRRFPHTFLNKLTGLMLFLIPLALPFLNLTYSVTAVSIAATLAALQEG